MRLSQYPGYDPLMPGSEMQYFTKKAVDKPDSSDKIGDDSM
jgi:hypothetical protein